MPTKDGDATVTPNQPWTQDGTALVAPIAPFPEPNSRTTPLKNRGSGTFTVNRSDDPLGFVVIPSGNEPQTPTAVLPIKASSGDSVQVDDDFFADWPDGFVIWFLAR